jgi:hypothetical protein
VEKRPRESSFVGGPIKMTVTEKQTLPYETYVDERKLLAEIEQQNYDNYEKTILTLSASFLAFSISFLGLFRDEITAGYIFKSQGLLIGTWISFAVSVISMLVVFLVGALSVQKEIVKIENALEDVTALEERNGWIFVSDLLYFISGIAFISGIVFLLLFCSKNIFLILA